MNYYKILDTVESSSSEEWAKVDAPTHDGHSELYVFHEDASITLAWGKDHMDGESWTEAWSESGGFPDKRIFGHYLDIRYSGVPINRDLVLSVDGHRGILPSGHVIADSETGITGMKVTQPELQRARLLDALVYGRRSQFDRYSQSANVQVV